MRRRRLTPTVGWRLAGGGPAADIDPRLVALVAAAARRGTLVGAARDVGLSYRAAWGLLENVRSQLGEPLLALARGRGATVAPLGQRLLDAHRDATAALADARFYIALRPGTVQRPAAPALKVAASHDIALAQLRDRWRLAHGVAVEFVGSSAALAAYRNGNADLAGFHVPSARLAVRDPLIAMLDAKRDALIPFLRRQQGLIVPRGNPRRLRTVADIATKRLRFVNRQVGSGTRMLFDRLLTQKHVAPSDIDGYTSEEFTHAAVAATVASGRADVAFGIAAAAAQFGLSFLPVVRERYLFVCRRGRYDAPRIAEFRALLASDATRAVVTPLPGYTLE